MQLNIVAGQSSTNLSLGVSEERNNELAEIMAELVGKHIMTNMQKAREFVIDNHIDKILDHIERKKSIPEEVKTSNLYKAVAEKCNTLEEYTICIIKVHPMLEIGMKTVLKLDEVLSEREDSLN